MLLIALAPAGANPQVCLAGREFQEKVFAFSMGMVIALANTFIAMNESLNTLQQHFGSFIPECVLVLGSGLGDFAEHCIEGSKAIDYSSIPGFMSSTVRGHRGRLVCGQIGSLRVACMQGRLHYYEGYTQAEITYPLRVLHAWGASGLVITNAAGGIRGDLTPGSLMLIRDHLNFTGMNPLIGNSADGQPRFPDMSQAYCPRWRAHAESLARTFEQELKVTSGVYLATTGPSFETPAEVRAFALMGADAVGMSTVPEVIVANQLGMRVLGISFISNRAAGLGSQLLSEAEVFENAARVEQPFQAFLKACLAQTPELSLLG